MNFMGDILAYLSIFGRNITCQDKQLYSTETFSANSLAYPANPRAASPVSLIYPIGSSLDESVIVMFPLSLPRMRIAPSAMQCPGQLDPELKEKSASILSAVKFCKLLRQCLRPGLPETHTLLPQPPACRHQRHHVRPGLLNIFGLNFAFLNTLLKYCFPPLLRGLAPLCPFSLEISSSFFICPGPLSIVLKEEKKIQLGVYSIGAK